MHIEMIDLAALVPYAKNARIHDESQIALLAKSIDAYGFNNPVLVDAAGGIVAGHGRVMAAQRLCLTHVPCVRLAHLTDVQKRAYIIADNKLASMSRWDFGMLADEVRELIDDDGLTADLLAFDAAEIDKLFGEFTGDAIDTPLDNLAAGQAAEGDDNDSPRQPVKSAGILVPVLINLTPGEMKRWRAIKKANSLDDNTAAFKRLTGIDDELAA